MRIAVKLVAERDNLCLLSGHLVFSFRGGAAARKENFRSEAPNRNWNYITRNRLLCTMGAKASATSACRTELELAERVQQTLAARPRGQ